MEITVVNCHLHVTCRTAWVQKIKAASEEFIETEKKKREKVYQGLSLTTSIRAAKISRLTSMGVFAARSVKATGIGRLLVTILEATELKAAKLNGECGHTHTHTNTQVSRIFCLGTK